jgi:hypothetical protein
VSGCAYVLRPGRFFLYADGAKIAGWNNPVLRSVNLPKKEAETYPLDKDKIIV